MKTHQSVLMLVLFSILIALSNVHALEMTDDKGALKSKVIGGKIYNAGGIYTGMITPEGKMYDKDGTFTGQIKNQNILNKDGSSKGFIRDGKIYDKDGLYKGELKL